MPVEPLDEQMSAVAAEETLNEGRRADVIAGTSIDPVASGDSAWMDDGMGVGSWVGAAKSVEQNSSSLRDTGL